MKKIIIPILALAIVSFTVIDDKLTDAERLVAMTELTTTHDRLLKTIDGLSAEQLNFKASPESWSVAENTEHLAISETNIFGMLKKSLKSPADPSKRADVKMTDEQILAMIADRTNKVKTSKPFEPTGKYGSHSAAVKEFKTTRVNHIKYIATTKDDLRNHYSELPVGTVDAYQVLLFMSAHTERHILQIEEVIANANFPK